MPMQRRSFLIALFAGLVAVSPAAPANAQSFDHKGLARLIVENHIRPGYYRLLEAARAFSAEAKAFCDAAPGQPTDTLKGAFRDLVLAWGRIEHMQFGPVMDERRHARVFYWPDRKGLGRRQVRTTLAKKDARSLDPVSLADRSVALQGLGAAEILLFREGAEEFASPGPARDYRCGYLNAIAVNLVNIIEGVQSAWNDGTGYAAVFLTPGADNPAYLDEREVTLEIAKAFLVGLERLRDIEIAGPLGLSPKTSRRTRAAFEPAGLSTQFLAAKLEGMMMLYVAGGLRDRIETHKQGLGETIFFELNLALNHLKSVEQPMSAVPVNREAEDRFLASGFPLKNAREQTRRVLSEAAGLSLGFNALDGD